jgi:toxin-antitoxin system PIN domain toxin
LVGLEPVLIPWVNLIGFTRITTHPKLLPNPLTADQALSLVELWLGAPPVRTPAPGPGHAPRVRSLLAKAGDAGNLVNDAHLAALALDNRAQVVTFDTDFALFDGVAWTTPAALLAAAAES